MDVKVKTLDGRTHEFSVPDNSTVLQFKGIIRDKMDIEIDRQRLLFQGRVLQDDMLLSSYDVAGNVMHLVTRLPPQARAATPVTTEREENSDINRDQIRNILSDVFNNIGDLNNPMGMDITVNIPNQNRLSLSRLRQNYVMRLLTQAQAVVNHMNDPSTPAPIADRDHLRQTDPYDIGPNETTLTDVTSQPLPISHLADMIAMTRALWTSAEPQLALWERVLRHESGPENSTRTESEMQVIHDSASRYAHLFGHILHILSDYLVEFQPNTTTSVPVTRPNVTETVATDATTSVSVDENNTPLTGACGESGMAPPPPYSANVPPVSITNSSEIADRSRYLYVFSEMPAQLVQVRLDVDSNIRDLRTTPIVPSTQTNTPEQPPTTTQSAVPNESPVSGTPTNADNSDQRARPQRRFQANGHTVENLFHTTIQDTIIGSNTRPQMSTATRTIRTAPQFIDNVDPYVRCQSRHFQHPSNLRSGSVLSTFSGMTIREPSRQRPAARNGATGTTATPTTNNPATPVNNVRSQATETDQMRSFFNGLMHSIFPGPGDIPRHADTETYQPATGQTHAPLNIPNEFHRIFQSFTNAGGSNFNAPLAQLFPEMLNNQDLDPDNFVTNQIILLIVSTLTLADFLAIINGHHTSLNQLRRPLQELLLNHQRQVGSRDVLVDHVVSDLEFFNRAYIAVFERLRSGSPIENLSEEARNSFNSRLDIFKTINRLNKYHFQSIIDMIMRSPTDHGFGQLLMNGLTAHHNGSLALIDIICNDNDELRQFLVKSFLDSLLLTMTNAADNNGTPRNQNAPGLDLIFNDINFRLFQRPDNLAALKQEVLDKFAVYFMENGNAVAAADNIDESIGNVDSIEDMVTNLSEHIINGTIITELQRPMSVASTNLINHEYNTCVQAQGENIESDWQSIVPAEWIETISRDSSSQIDTPIAPVPYSDAYVTGMPPKRRKIIINQRQKNVQPSAEMMHDCMDQAMRSAGVVDSVVPSTVALTDDLKLAFQEMVSNRIGKRLNDESANFPAERFPSTEHNFNRENRHEEKKSN